MENLFKKALGAAISVTIIALLCGCNISNNNAEKNNVLIAETINVDFSDNAYKLTVQGVNPGGEQLDQADAGGGEQGSEGSSEEKPPQLFGAQGKSLVEAFDSLSFTNGRNVLTAHNQVVLFGKDTLEKHLFEGAEFFAACNEIPVEAAVYGIKNDTAEKVTDSAAKENISIAKKIYDLNRASAADMKAVGETVLGIMSKQYGGLSDIALPVFSFDNEELKSDGTAVFSNNTFKGYLTEEETMTLLLIKGKGDGGRINTNGVYYKINSSKTDWNIKFLNDTPFVTLNIELFADINHYENKEKINNGKGEKILSTYFNNSLQSLTEKLCREYKSDVIGFTNRFSYKYPLEFKKYKSNRLNLFEKAVFDFNVNVSLENIEKNGTFPDIYF